MTNPLIKEPLVLPPGADTLARIEAVARDSGWCWAARIPAAPRQLHEEIWVVDDQVQVRYIDDRYVDTRLLSVQGNDGQAVYRRLEHLRQQLGGEQREDLLVLADKNDPAIRMHAISGLAASTPEFDIEVFEAVRDALDSEVRALRERAFQCIARLAWYEFAAELERRLASRDAETWPGQGDQAFEERMQSLAKDLRATAQGAS